MFQDYLFSAVDQNVRYAVRMLHMSHVARHAQKVHQLNAGRAVLLSDALLGSLLLSSILDNEDIINLRIQCGSDFTIGTESTYEGHTRGYIECAPGAEHPLIEALDGGELPPALPLHVRTLRSPRDKKQQLYEGNSFCVAASVEEAINEHLTTSYQMQTFVKLSSWVDKTGQLCAFGALYQELPDIAPEVSQGLKQHIQMLPSLQTLYEENSDPDVLAARLVPDVIRGLKSVTPQFVCTCSPTKMEQALALLGSKEIQDMIAKKESPQIRCHYCNVTYTVETSRLEVLL